MSLKNKPSPSQSPLPSSLFTQLQPHSLRWRLVLWYGSLVSCALILFALLILLLTMDSLYQSVTTQVETETRAASAEVQHELTSVSPFWPAQLSLNSLSTYSDPGIVVEVISIEGKKLYDSDDNFSTNIPLTTTTKQAVLSGQTIMYSERLTNESVQVEAVPIYAPGEVAPGQVAGESSLHGSAIGILLVAKSLSNVERTLTILRTLFLLIGGATLLGVLLGGWIIASRVLHPLAEIAKTARTIAETTAQGTRIGNLSPRVKKPRGDDEMAQVVDAFNTMLADLEKATQGQRRFVADASHELRAPLTTIQGNLAFLQQHADMLPAEERKTVLQDAYEETLRLAQLVNELLLLARADANMDAPHLSLSKKQAPQENKPPLIELDGVVLQLVRQMRGRLAVEESKLKVEIGHIEPVRVRGDEESLRRVILILLDNALKYTPPSTARGKGCVTVSVERQEQEAVLQVSDTGIGIEPEELSHIFERFYRTDRARLRQGTGLGLAIAKTLVEQLHGRITVESMLGQGSSFQVRLPLV